MALEATHIRFALDMESILNIGKHDQYISGTVYPDSRYTTKTNRELTHPQDFTTLFIGSDHDKGWAVHLLCDKIQKKLHNELFTAYLTDDSKVMTEETWIERTALKIIQDIVDVEHIDIQAEVNHLTSAFNPNNEDANLLQKYHDMLKNMYIKKNARKISSRYVMFDKKYVKSLKNKMKEYQYINEISNITQNKIYESMFTEGQQQITSQ